MTHNCQFNGVLFKNLLEHKSSYLITLIFQILIPSVICLLFYSMSLIQKIEKEQYSFLMMFFFKFWPIMIMFPLTALIVRVVYEKSTGMKELVKSVGVDDLNYYGPLIVIYFINFYVITLLTSWVLIGYLIPMTKLIFYSMLFSMTLVMYALAFTTFFRNHGLAAGTMAAVWHLLNTLPNQLIMIKPGFMHWLVMILFPPTVNFTLLCYSETKSNLDMNNLNMKEQVLNYNASIPPSINNSNYSYSTVRPVNITSSAVSTISSPLY